MIDLTLLKTDDIKARAKWKCPLDGHSKHNGLEHPNCYESLHSLDLREKIGFLDIETGDLKADFGIMFCYCIKDRNSDKIYEDRITLDDIKKYSSKKRDVNTKEDTRIIKSLVKDMGNFTRLVGHFSSIFDLPFIRTRAMICGIDFPTYGQYCQTDTWRILKSKFKLSRNSLENSCRKLLGATQKDYLSLSIKHGCIRGEEWALKDSIVHCRKDVLDTEKLYNAINGFMRSTKASI